MKIETIFGAVAVLALVGLIAFALTSGERGVRAAVPGQAATTAQTASPLNACGCYDQAYGAARTNPDFTRPLYEGGYDACRESAGQSGGRAWSAGWQAGIDGRRRSCRAGSF